MRSRIIDLSFGLVCGISVVLGAGVLFWIVFDLLIAGLPHLSMQFLTGEVLDSGRSGGIASVLISTFGIIIVCMLVAIPFGVATAFWVTEVGGSSRLLTSVDLLASVPSIVFGLFGMAFFCHFLGMGFSILAGGLTLAVMILPIMIRISINAIRSLPDGLRASAASLGLSRVSIIFKVLLPSAVPGLLAGFTIGLARALSETAALIFTSGYATRMPDSLFDSGRALSVHIYDMAMNIPGGGNKASSSALVLLSSLFVINLFTHLFSRKWSASLNR